MFKKTIPIKGMHCRSCEILVEEELKGLPSVYYTGVSYKKGVAEIHSHQSISDDLISKAVEASGYTIGKNDKKGWVSKEARQYKDLGVAFLVLALLYLVLRLFGLTDLKIDLGAPSSFFVVFLVGLTAGISTCM